MRNLPSFIQELLSTYNKEPKKVIEKMTGEDFFRQKQKQLEYEIKAAAIGIVKIGSEIILTKRSGPHAGWALPGGRIEMAESIREGFLREVQEETGIEAVILDMIALEEKIFVSPKGERLSLWLVCFVADAKSGQRIMQTEEAVMEGLEVSIFSPSHLPNGMVATDEHKIRDYFI